MSLRLSARTQVRWNRYKVSVDADEGRRRREDNMVEIRKIKREEGLLKKRCEGLQAQNQFPSSIHASTVEKRVLVKLQLESLPSMVALQFPATRVFGRQRNLKCRSNRLTLVARYSQTQDLFTSRLQERSLPIEEVIQAGVVPCFVEFLIEL